MVRREEFRGIANEDGRFDKWQARLAVRAVKRWEKKYAEPAEITYLGDSLPLDGPAVVVSLHPDTESALRLPLVVANSGRVVDMIVKETLLNPKVPESTKVLEATGKTGGEIFSSRSNEGESKIGIKSKFKKRLVMTGKEMAVPFIRETVNAIPVDRDGESRKKLAETLRRSDETLHDGRILGLFLQWTRTPENSLKNIKELAATIVRRNKNVPVYVMAQVHGADGRLHMVLDKPFTYESLLAESGKNNLSREEVTTHMADRAFNLLALHIPKDEIIPR